MFTKREKLILCLWLLSWLVIPVAAQVRPGLFSTLVTTDTGANSLLVGGAAGGTTGTGGIKAGQMTLGGGTAITSSSNIALKDTANAFTAANSFTVNNTATSALAVRFNASNSLTGFGVANSNGFVYLGNNTKSKTGSDTATYDINGAATQLRVDSGAFKFLTASAGTAGNDITFSERWGINNAGDLTFGSSSHIALSNGTPSLISGFGTSPSVAGTDYAMTVNVGTTPGTLASAVITFGHTWSSTPVCSATLGRSSGTMLFFGMGLSTSGISISSNGALTNNDLIHIVCHGY